MDIRIMSKDNAEDFFSYSHEKEWACVSITDFDEIKPLFQTSIATKRLVFSDIETTDNIPEDYINKRNLKFFTKEIAYKIKTFVDLITDFECGLIVHCHAGISRSSAVAFALEEYFNKCDSKKLFKQHGYAPNMEVYAILCEELGIEKSKEELATLDNINQEQFRNSDKFKEMFEAGDGIARNMF